MPGNRPRGHIANWKPQQKTLALIADVQTVLAQYVPTYGPMTIRQVFYRLVATIAYEKTETAYKNLIEHVGNARRARVILFAEIRDDGDTVAGPPGWQSVRSFVATFRYSAAEFTLRRDIGQPYRTIVVVEAGGMVPQVARVCSSYGVEVRSAGGFDGLTGKYALARNIAEHFEETGRPTRLLHVGDYDPSGEHIYKSLVEDIGAFVGDTTDAGAAFIPERIALTPQQIVEFALPTAPAKPGDRRSFAGVGGDGVSTVQCEALSPADLAQIVEGAILASWDLSAAAVLKTHEEDDRERLETIIDNLMDDKE